LMIFFYNFAEQPSEVLKTIEKQHAVAQKECIC